MVVPVDKYLLSDESDAGAERFCHGQSQTVQRQQLD